MPEVRTDLYRSCDLAPHPTEEAGDANMQDGSKKVEVVYVKPHELRIEKKLQHPPVDKKSATALDSLTLALAWGVKRR